MMEPNESQEDSSEDEEIQRLKKERSRLDKLIEVKRKNKQKTKPRRETGPPEENLPSKIQNNATTPIFRFYEKREGAVVPDDGAIFEYTTCGLYALKLLANESVADFEMTTNNKESNFFDDLEINVTFKNNRKASYLFQFKHRYQNQRITREMLTQEYFRYNNKQQKSKYYLAKYFQSVEHANNVANTKKFYVLYTNGDTDLENGSKLNFKKKYPSCIVRRSNQMEHQDLLLNNRTDGDLIFQFEPDPENDCEGNEKMKNSWNNFYLFTKQENTETIQGNIKERLLNLLKCDISETFKNFMMHWWLSNFILTKHILLIKLTELALSPHIKAISDKCSNDKTTLLKEAIMNFEMTIIEEDLENVVTNIWPEVEEDQNWNLSPLQKLDETVITNVDKSKILWQLGKVPLIIKVDDSNENVVKSVLRLLHQQVLNKVVLLGKIKREDFRTWAIFENFFDVVGKYSQLQWCSDIMNIFRVSLQGREHIPLKRLMDVDQHIAKFVTINDLLMASQKLYFLLSSEKAELPEIHISRKLFKKRELVQETEIFDQFQEPLKVVCASAGMGKSRLLQVLSCNCPPDLWALHRNLIDCNRVFEKHKNLDTITSKLLEFSEDDRLTEIKKILLENGKMEIFLDGLDEVDRKYLDLVMKWVNFMLSRGARIWVSSRDSLRKQIRKTLKVSPVKMQEFNEEEQKTYIRLKLRAYKPEKIDQIIKAISESVDVVNSRQLLGVPLLLHICTDIFLYDANAFEKLKNKNIFVVTQILKYYFAGKKRFTFEKMGIDENVSEHLGMDFESYLEQYEIPALRLCLDLEDFKKLKVGSSRKYESFLERIKTHGDKYGIIKKVNSHKKAVFEHQTFAEYFACVWLRKNKDKITSIQDEFFYFYDSLRHMFDVMLAEEKPLHLAVIYQNLIEFDKYLDAKFEEKDEGGRTPLHLACCYGTQDDLLATEKPEDPLYMKMVDMLIKKCTNIHQSDNLFGFDYMQYLEQTTCLYPLEKFLEHKLLPVYEMKLDTFDYRKRAYTAARLRYLHLLSAIVCANPDVLNSHDQNLLHAAIEGCYDDDFVQYEDKDVAVVEFLVKKGVDVNQIDSCNKTPLDLACTYGWYDVIPVLIRNGATCTSGNTILHLIARHQTIDIRIRGMKNELNIDVNAMNKRGQTALHMASWQGSVNNVEELLKMGSNCDILDLKSNNALHWACLSRKDNSQIINILLNRGLDINSPNSERETPLLLACQEGCIENVKVLIDRDADLTVLDKFNNTAVMLACTSHKPHNSEILSLLCSSIDINAQNLDGNSALHTACYKRSFEKVKFLNEKNADFTIVDNRKNTALHYACSSKKANTKVINFLLDKGIDINAQNVRGETPLHFACARGIFKNVSCLTERNADLTIMDFYRNSTLHFVSRCGYDDVEILRLVWHETLDPNVKNSEGKTAIQIANLEKNIGIRSALSKGNCETDDDSDWSL